MPTNPNVPPGPVVTRPDPLPRPTPRPDDRDVDAPVERPDPRDADTPTEIPPTRTVTTRPGLTPANMAGEQFTRLALVLPFNSANPRLREEAASMLRAAQLAVFDRDEADVVLLALDSGGTKEGSQRAVSAAVAQGADVILGPVLADGVRAAGRAARRSNTPVIAFSTDTNVAGNGVYLLSFPPEAEVDRVVEYAASTGATHFAMLRPESAYGERVAREYDVAVARRGARITASETYRGTDIAAMQAPAQRLAEFHARVETETGGRGKAAFEAIMLPVGGTALRQLAPLLPYYNSQLGDVQYLGTGLWQDPATAREPALNGGVFAGPDRDPREQFARAYERAYGDSPSRLASLAHDAVLVGATIATGDPRGRRARAEDIQGFYGADGFVRFGPDGTPDRGLAVYEIRSGTFRIVDPAPRGATGFN